MATHAAVLPGAALRSLLWAWVTTVDHKRVGVLYGTTAFTFFLFGGLEALLMRAQLARPDNTLVSAETYNELFTMHGTTMIFLALMPLSTAFINFAVPLLIGSRDVAFPRLNALSYWIFLAGGLFLNAGWLFGAVPDAGWFGYANLTSLQFSPGAPIDVWVLSIQLLGISSLLGALNFVVTIINTRAPGMTLMRMPVFVWMVLVTQFLILRLARRNAHPNGRGEEVDRLVGMGPSRCPARAPSRLTFRPDGENLRPWPRQRPRHVMSYDTVTVANGDHRGGAT
jgi:cytochrome c oxidase subunit I